MTAIKHHILLSLARVSKSLGMFFVFGASATAPSQVYRVTNIGTFGGINSYASAINSPGQVAGSAEAPGGRSFAFLWSNGVLQNLGTLGGYDSFGRGLNDSGQVVGWSAASTGYHAFVYSGGTMQDLGTLGGTNSYAVAINDVGQAVGWSYTANDAAINASLWFGRSEQNLGQLGGTGSLAYAINQSGQVVGYSSWSRNSNIGHAFLWTSGVMRDLGTLGGSGSEADAINSSGQVAGDSYITGDLEAHAFVYSRGVMQDLGTLGGSNSLSSGINASSAVVGDSYISGDVDSHAFLYSGGLMRDLNSLVDSTGARLTLVNGVAINDKGYIACNGRTPAALLAVLLTPYFVDNPTSYAITAGLHRSGTLSSLFNVDRSYLVARAGPLLAFGLPPLSVVVTGTSSYANPADVRLQFVGHVDSLGLKQTIAFYDYQANAWVLASSAGATTTDFETTAIATNPGRFVKAGTNEMKSRLSWTVNGPISHWPWSAYMDQAVWNVSP